MMCMKAPFLITVLNNLEQASLLIQGSFVMYAKDKSYMKVTPSAIRLDLVKLASLQSFDISIDDYEMTYRSMILPTTTKLSSEGVSFVTSCPDFVPYYHLDNQSTKDMVNKGKIKPVIIDNFTQYVVTNNEADNGIEILSTQQAVDNVIPSSANDATDHEQRHARFHVNISSQHRHQSSPQSRIISHIRDDDEEVENIMNRSPIKIIEQHQQYSNNSLQESAGFDHEPIQSTSVIVTNTASTPTRFEDFSPSSIILSTPQIVVTSAEINAFKTGIDGSSANGQQIYGNNKSIHESSNEFELGIPHHVSHKSKDAEQSTDGGQFHLLLPSNISYSQAFPQQHQMTTDDATSSIDFVLALANNSSLLKRKNNLKRSSDSENEPSAKRPALIPQHRSNENTPTIDLVSDTAKITSDKESID